jgi:hypothetical protein
MSKIELEKIANTLNAIKKQHEINSQNLAKQLNTRLKF